MKKEKVRVTISNHNIIDYVSISNSWIMSEKYCLQRLSVMTDNETTLYTYVMIEREKMSESEKEQTEREKRERERYIGTEREREIQRDTEREDFFQLARFIRSGNL